MQSSSRNGVAVRALAVHTAEGILTVDGLRAFFDRSTSSSCHAAADASGELADGAADGFVDYDRAAWTIRNGNPWTENLELCAFAAWTRDQWLAAPALLEACATWLARRSKARGIPLDKLTPDQLRVGQHGVIDHDDYTDATGDGTHWDVGEHFPWDIVIPRARQIAGGAPAPAPTRRRRRRTMYLTRDTVTGAVYLWDGGGARHIETTEEWSCAGWLLDDTRDANATLGHNPRFHDVLVALFAKPHVQRRVGVAAGEPLGPPVDLGDPDAIAPPPGFVMFAPDAPGHD